MKYEYEVYNTQGTKKILIGNVTAASPMAVLKKFKLYEDFCYKLSRKGGPGHTNARILVYEPGFNKPDFIFERVF